MPPVRVLLVDDHDMLTEALTARLSSTPDMWVAGRCATEDPHSADLATLLRPDVITIEVTTARDPAALLGRFRSACPGAHIVVLTESHSTAQAVEAARAGADGWVSKESSVQILARVLRWACRGHAWFPAEQLGAILRELRADVERVALEQGPLDVLTRRERAVLMGMVRGLSTVQIAEELGVTANTVRTHTNKIFSKLNVHSRLEAAGVARLTGLHPDEDQSAPQGTAPTT